MKKLLFILTIYLTLTSCSDSKNNESISTKFSQEIVKYQADTINKYIKMKLTVLSDYGSNEKVISDSTTIDQIIETMNSINWNEFHQVILGQNNGDWMEIGGNLSNDGLSAMYQENGKQYVINKPPVTVDHMTTILLSYFTGDGRFKSENKFE